MTHYLRLTLFFLLTSLYTTAQDCSSERYSTAIFSDVTITEVLYSTADSYDLFNQNNPEDFFMDIYEPMGDMQTKRPVVFMLFGGGFTQGDKQDADIVAWCDSLARYGYVAVAINYRLGYNSINIGSAKRAIYRGMQDANAAIRYMIEFQDTYRIDPNHIYIGGKSSGGIISMNTIFMGEESDRLPETYTSTFDPSDMGCMSCSGNNYQHEFEVKGVMSLWGAILDTSAITVNEQVPTLLIHGDGDILVPYDSGYPISGSISLTFPYLYGSLSIHERMGNIGINNALHTYDYNNHDVYANPANFPNENWESIWELGKDFYYQRVIPQTSMPQGDANPISNQNYTYTVANNMGSVYCWEITNGNIITSNGNEVTVEWLAGTGNLAVTEENCIGAVGNQKTIEVNAATNTNETTIPNVSVFPNVLKGEREIIIDNNYMLNSIIKGRIIDARGKLVHEFQTLENRMQTPDFPIGMYYLELQIGMKKGVYKLIVTN